jgi:hypothetical protein
VQKNFRDARGRRFDGGRGDGIVVSSAAATTPGEDDALKALLEGLPEVLAVEQDSTVSTQVASGR